MSIDKLSVKELRELAARLGIRNRSKMRKKELVSAIQAAEGLAEEASAAVNAPSSATSTVEETPPQAFGPDGDPGLPIPEHYDSDRLVLMVQDPTNVYAYWEIRQETLQRLRAEHGRQTATLLLVHCGGSLEQRFVDLTAGNYYLSLPPGQDCRVELALRDEQGQLHVFLSSNQVHTPSHRVSDHSDVEWMDVDERFATLLEMAELDSTLTSADLVRRLETVKWDVPNLPSSDSLVSSLGLSSALLSSASLSSTSWQQPASQTLLQSS